MTTSRQINSPPRISAVVNTLNEEANIRHCLETLAWCDEIVVVDMQSNDAIEAVYCNILGPSGDGSECD